MSAAARKPFELKGSHVLIIILAFFGVTIGVNIGFATMAVRSFPGEDAQSPYQQGLHYNKMLQARRDQATLGWSSNVAIAPAKDGALLIVTFTDSRKQPVTGLKLDGALRRPASGKYDVPLRFTAGENGRYSASLPAIEPGLWDLRATATGGAHPYDIDERLVWRPSTQH
jgi:nitrogen fixation protein FixH